MKLFEIIFGHIENFANTILAFIPEEAQTLLLVIAIVAIILGLVIALAGFRLYVLVLRLVFLVAGLFAGKFIYGMIPIDKLQDFEWGGWILGLVIGLVLAVLAKKFLNYLLFVLITTSSYLFLAPYLSKVITPEVIPEGAPFGVETAVAIGCIAVGILASFLFVYVLLPIFLIVGTSFGGALVITSSALLGFEQQIIAAFADSTQMAMSIAFIVIAVIGLVVQATSYKKKSED